MKALPERTQPGRGYRTGERQGTVRVGQRGQQLRSPDLLQRPLAQGLYPQFLGMLGVGIKVLPTAFESLGRTQRLPAGGLVIGAPKALGIDKGFHYLHRIPKVRLPILGQALTESWKMAKAARLPQPSPAGHLTRVES